MNKQAINEWRQFLKEGPAPQEISDEVIQLIFSDQINRILEQGSLNEGLADRAKSIAKKYGIPLGIAMSITTGAISAKQFAEFQNARNAEISAQADAPKPGDYAYHRSDSKPPGYSDLSNRESIEKSWEDISNLGRSPAPVTGVAPVMIDGNMRMLRFSHIPASELAPDTVLPMSLMTAESYRLMLEERLERGPKEIIYLKKMIFGDTGKWASGSGNEVYRIEGNSALLPPEWSIAHEVYAAVVEARLREMVNYVKEQPNLAPEIYEQLGVQDDDHFHEFINDQLFKIGRQ